MLLAQARPTMINHHTSKYEIFCATGGSHATGAVPTAAAVCPLCTVPRVLSGNCTLMVTQY